MYMINYIKIHKIINIFLLSFVVISVFLIMMTGFAQAEDDYYQLEDGWKYTITNEIEVQNTSSEASRNIRITVPLINTDMPIYQQLLGEQFDPWPEEIITDSYGNREAVYIIPYLGAKQTITLKQSYLVINYGVKYTFNVTNITSAYSDDIDDIYLSPSSGIESNSAEVIAYAKEIAGTETNPYILARKAFADINLYLTYVQGENANKGALNALRTGEGVCEDYTDLFIAVMRALGIPARKQTGYIYLPYDYNTEPYFDNDTGWVNLNIMTHSWPEFYLQDIGWVACDPTFTYEVSVNGVLKKFVDWSYFANIPVSRDYIFFGSGHSSDSVQYSYTGGELQVSFDAKMAIGERYLPFNDIEGHWAKDSIVYLSEEGLIKGIGDGLFGVNEPVTRAQMAAILYRIFEPEAAALDIKDVKTSYWAYYEIAAVKNAGLMVGYLDGSFKPNQTLTRAEIAAILVRAFQLTATDDQVFFSDLGKSGWLWADQPIITLSNLRLASGVGDGLFKPEQTLTRAELAVFLANCLHYQASLAE